jgi:hypothetical protein
MSVVIPFRDPRVSSQKARLAARRAYREGCKQVAASAFAEAFTKSLKLPAVGQTDIADAVSIFAGCMRRQLRLASGAGFGSVRP